jgi:hypothetical protein
VCKCNCFYFFVTNFDALKHFTQVDLETHVLEHRVMETLNHCLNPQLSSNTRTNRGIEVRNQNSSEKIENSNSYDECHR